MGGFDDLKSKITYENKTIFGVVGIIIGFLFWGIGHPSIGIGDVLILIFPAILLIIPNETIKNSKALSIIAIIILTLFLLVGLSSLSITLTQYVPDSWAFSAGYVEAMLLANILQLILCIYGLFCAVLLLIPTKQNQKDVIPYSNVSLNNKRKYDKYCSKCGQGLFNDAQFCPKCGTKVMNVIQEDLSHVENNDNHCSECGHELKVDSKFCPECGAEVINDVQEDFSQDKEEESLSKICSECGHELKVDSKFCPECGAEASNDVQEDFSQDKEEESLSKSCSECGHELDEDSQFCSECGAEIITEENIK